jgi:hypothetical protein
MQSDAIEPIVELAIIVALMVFVYRGGLGSAQALWTRRGGIVIEDPIRLVVFAIIVLLFVGFLANLLTGATADR